MVSKINLKSHLVYTCIVKTTLAIKLYLNYLYYRAILANLGTRRWGIMAPGTCTLLARSYTNFFTFCIALCILQPNN